MWWILILGLVFVVFLFFVGRRFYYENLVCEYCGKFTLFSLCFDCKQRLKRKDLYFCHNCNGYFSQDKQCKCSLEERTLEYKERKELEHENEMEKLYLEHEKEMAKLRKSIPSYRSSYRYTTNTYSSYSNDMSCFICGADSSDNKHLCLDCYKKYKDHTVILKLEGGKKVTVEEKYYEGARILTADGHNVRSDGERAIDNFFYHRMIPHSYEKPLYLDKNKYKVEFITPDFYLPKQNAYVEFLGYSGEQYIKENEFKRKIYTALGVTVIYLYRDDKDTLDAKLDYYLKNIQPGKLNHIRLDNNGKMVI